MSGEVYKGVADKRAACSIGDNIASYFSRSTLEDACKNRAWRIVSTIKIRGLPRPSSG
jgi:hypothetical protein